MVWYIRNLDIFYIPHDKGRDLFHGPYPNLKDCLEGLASRPAVEKKWGKKPEKSPKDHPVWHLEGDYLSLAAANLFCTKSPEVIVFWGGVMSQ